jgi:DNA-binding MarR family transcriptional regulator
LGRRSDIDRSDMVALVNELTDRHLVDRTSDAIDRRRNVIAINPEGRRYLRKLDIRVSKIQDELLAPLSANERRQLVRLLTLIVDHHSVSESPT